MRALAESAVAVMIASGRVDRTDPANVRVTYSGTLGEAQSLCPGEPFADQIAPGRCSGTLIDDRHILTAAHCVDSPEDCSSAMLWVLGFRYGSPGALATLTSNDVYSCVRVVGFVYDPAVDYAVVELERPVVGHVPATVSASTPPLAIGAPLTLIGHPDGIPSKIAGGGAVLSTDATVLRASVDAFHGNSGSGVFDAAGTLVAILTAGAPDYVASGTCNVVNVLDPAFAPGETLNYAAPAIAAMCRTPGLASPLCGCAGPCVPAGAHDLCGSAEPIPPGTTHITGSLDGFGPDASGSCGGLGPERFYSLTLDSPSRVRVSLTGYDSVLYLLRGCGGAEIACNDDVDSSDLSSRIVADLAPGTYVLAIDAYGGATGVTFDLEIAISALSPDAGPVVIDGGASADAGSIGGTDAGSMTDASSVDLDAAWPMDAGSRALDAGSFADVGARGLDARPFSDASADGEEPDAAPRPGNDTGRDGGDGGGPAGTSTAMAGCDCDVVSPAAGYPGRPGAWLAALLLGALTRRRRVRLGGGTRTSERSAVSNAYGRQVATAISTRSAHEA